MASLGEELHEMKEHAEHDRSLAPVSVSMGVMAVFLAATTLLGHRAHTEEVLIQNDKTNNWSHYQAKRMRQQTAEMFIDLVKVAHFQTEESDQKIREKYAQNVERYQEELKELDGEGKKLDDELKTAKARGNRFDLGEVSFEVALVLTSLTLLTGKRTFWAAGGLLSLTGLLIAGLGFLVP